MNSFSRGDVDGGYGASFAPPSGPGLILFPSETADSIHGHEQITQEFRIDSAEKGNPLKWQGGVYLFHEKYEIDAYGYDTLGGGVQSSLYRTEQKSNSYAAFGSASYDITPLAKVSGGLRYTHDKKDLSTQDAPGIVSTNGLGKDTSDGKVSWDLSGIYAVTPDANVYARAATGYRGSSIQPASGFGGQTFAGPETNLSFEVGFKADLLDKRARTSLTLYQYRVKDQQLTAVGGASNTTTLLNAKKAIGRGVEGDLRCATRRQPARHPERQLQLHAHQGSRFGGGGLCPVHRHQPDRQPSPDPPSPSSTGTLCRMRRSGSATSMSATEYQMETVASTSSSPTGRTGAR